MDLNYWKNYIDQLPYDPLFVTVSGAHIYGFPSPDSDIDLRGCHQLPLSKIVGLAMPAETFEKEEIQDGTEVDLVSHEIGKYLRLLVKNNGYIMEQVFSPLVVHGQSLLDRLRPLATACLTRNHFYHYRGFLGTQRKLIEKQVAKKAKTVLYAYRVVLTGTFLMQNGSIETDLRKLVQQFDVQGIQELIDSKTHEKITVDLDWDFHSQQIDRLESEMETAFEASALPEKPDRESINQLLIALRLDSVR